MQKEYMGEVCVEVNGVLLGLCSIPYFVFAYGLARLALLGTLSPSPPLSSPGVDKNRGERGTGCVWFLRRSGGQCAESNQ